MPFPTGGAPQGGGEGQSMMRGMQGALSPQGGMKPDELGGGGGGPNVSGILEMIESAPPEILMLLKQAIDAKLAMASKGGPPPTQ